MPGFIVHPKAMLSAAKQKNFGEFMVVHLKMFFVQAKSRAQVRHDDGPRPTLCYDETASKLIWL